MIYLMNVQNFYIIFFPEYNSEPEVDYNIPSWVSRHCPGLHNSPAPRRSTPTILIPPRPVPGRPRPTCKVSTLYLENCECIETDIQRQTILFIDIDIYLWNRIWWCVRHVPRHHSMDDEMSFSAIPGLAIDSSLSKHITTRNYIFN